MPASPARVALIACALMLVAMSATGVRAQGDGVAYEAVLVGVDEDDIEERIRDFAQLFTLRDTPPATLGSLRRRARADEERIREVLASLGYHAAEVDIAVEDAVTPVRVTVTVAPGPPYRLSRYTIENVGPHPLAEPIRVDYRELGLIRGDPAESAAILGAEQLLLDRMGERGRPLATIAERRVVVDHAAETVEVSLEIDAGPLALFGATAFEGLGRVGERFLVRRIMWRAGQPYDSREVAATRRALVETGLFDAIRINHADTVDGNGLLAMTIAVNERPARTVGAGVSYSTSEGPGAKAYWEHRNLLGEGERLRVSAGGTLIGYGLGVSGRKPDFFARRQALLVNFDVREEDTDAFVSRRIETSAAIERTIGSHYVATAGVTVSRSQIEERGVRESFTLVGTPLSVRRDTTDDLLDPSRGGRSAITATPFIRGLGSSLDFTVLEATHSSYWRLAENLVLAGWARAGVILGLEAAEIPADKRFYAGGGGSIRGYGFQLVGPLDAADNPQGGRSVYAVGAEARFRVTDTIGLVGFVEGGNVYTDLSPDFGGDGLLWSAGIGGRYFTGIGPLRVDVAVPLDRRAVDDAFQLYIGLGQAF